MEADCDLDQEIGAIHFVSRSKDSIMIWKQVTFEMQLYNLISPITWISCEFCEKSEIFMSKTLFWRKIGSTG